MGAWTLAALLVLSPLFEDATQPAGLEGVNGDRFAFADLDADGDPDLIVGGRRLFRNEKGRFVELPGALKGARGGSATAVDLTGDGRLDVLTSAGDLYVQGRRGAFRRVALPFPERQAAFGVGDVDGDGRPDILTGGGELWKDNRSHLFPRRLLLNLGGGKFRDATQEYGLEADRYGRSVVFADFDDDGDADVFLGNYRLAPNELWRNEGGRLRECGAELGCRGRPRRWRDSPECFGHTIGASWADLDGDGWLDLWASNLAHKFVGTFKGMGFADDFDFRGKICDDSNLYRNGGPPGFAFEDRRERSGIPIKPVGDRGVFRGDELWSNCACADFDNDGDLDVFVTQVYTLPYSHSFLFENLGGFRFSEVDPGFSVFNGYGAAWADVDGDGRPDLVTGGSVGAPKGPRGVHLWRNATGSTGRWIGFRFARPTLGAVVRVLCGGRVLARQAESGMGSHAQKNSGILHFGLGGADRIDDVRVSWPGGTEQRLRLPARPFGRVHPIRRQRLRRGPKRIELVCEGGALRCRPAVSGARYEWDLDDDFSTDETTRVPYIAAQRVPKNARSACVRAFVGGVALRARTALPSGEGSGGSGG